MSSGGSAEVHTFLIDDRFTEAAVRFGSLALVFLVACGDSTAPAAKVDVSTQVSAATLRPGESVSVTVLVTNRGGSTIELTTNSCPDPFVVTTSSGAEVGPAIRGCTLQLETKVLKPGESFTFHGAWTGTARQEDFNDPPQRLSAGTYLVHGRVLAAGVSMEGSGVPVQLMP